MSSDSNEQLAGAGPVEPRVSCLQTENQAREAIQAFLASVGWDGDYGLEKQVALDPEEGVWAFWGTDDEGNSRPYTSYLHQAGDIESYGI